MPDGTLTREPTAHAGGTLSVSQPGGRLTREPTAHVGGSLSLEEQGVP